MTMPARAAMSAMNSSRPAHIWTMATSLRSTGAVGLMMPTVMPLLQIYEMDSNTLARASLPCAMNAMAPKAPKARYKIMIVIACMASDAVILRVPK